MRYNGKIKKLEHIVISDPSYDDEVKCRYEKKGLEEKNWLVELDINELEEKIDGSDGTEFSLLLKKNEDVCEIDNDFIRYSNDIITKEYDIGVDTACVAYGINNKADKIIKNKNKWQPSYALKTLSDGIHGKVMEGKKNNNLSFLYIYGYFDNNTGYKEKDILKYLENNFEITGIEIINEIEINRFEKLNPGEKVEIYSCAITNDVGGTTMINHKNHIDKIDGMSLTVHQLDGSTKENIIHTNNPYVTMPIRVEVISGAYDYETGYNYKAKVIDDEVIDEFKKIGTTGYVPEDYKKYKNTSLYEETKKAAENFDPSIVYFSEFDVVRKIEKDFDKEANI